MRRTSLARRACARAGLFLALVAPGCSAEPAAPIETAPIARVEQSGAVAGRDLQASAVEYARGLAGEIGVSPGGDFAASPAPDRTGGIIRHARLQQLHAGLRVVGSAIHVHADDSFILGLAGVVTRNLDGLDTEPSVGAEEAAAIARADLAAISPGARRKVVSQELVVRPQVGGGARLAWQVDLASGWRTFVDAHGGGVLGAEPVAQGDLCGDGLCLGDETDATCPADCGCSSQQDLCGVAVPAPFGCWCDPDCEATGDCCADVDVCGLAPPNYESEAGEGCTWGESDAGFFDRPRLNFYRMKYTLVATGGALMGQEDAARYLLHFLGNSGTEMDIDVDRLLDEAPSFAETIEADRTERAEEIAADAEEAGATGSVKKDMPVEWRSTGVEAGESENWYHALHLFQYNQTGTTTVRPSGGNWTFEARGRVHVADYYDWAPEGSYGLFNQGELHELHCYGWAQNFWIRGVSSESALEGMVP